MGEVYRARDGTLQRDVALKILPEQFSLDPGRLARFRREAQVLASLNHPNIAAIYGFEESAVRQRTGHASVHALVLELVEGPTLCRSDRRRTMPPDWRARSTTASERTCHRRVRDSVPRASTQTCRRCRLHWTNSSVSRWSRGEVPSTFWSSIRCSNLRRTEVATPHSIMSEAAPAQITQMSLPPAAFNLRATHEEDPAPDADGPGGHRSTTVPPGRRTLPSSRPCEGERRIIPDRLSAGGTHGDR
jgi:hypothetical protein